MGTTLTAVNLLADRMVVGHVGDTRCYLLRRDRLRQVTQDHAVRRAEHHLVRCVGAGREHEEVDVVSVATEAGDVIVLATDGLWDAIDEETLRQVVRRHAAQAAAEELVRLAVAAGGVDNATALVVHVRATGPLGPRPLVTVEPPARELQRLPPIGALPSLKRSVWPWVTLALALVAGGLAVARLAFGVDPFGSG
jgi:protein phosphatase